MALQLQVGVRDMINDTKKLYLIAIIAASIASPLKANAGVVAENLYFQSDENKISGSQTSHVKLGYRNISTNKLLNKIKFEGELASSTVQTNYKSFGSNKIMTNMVYNVKQTSSFSSYIGIGAGVFQTSVSNNLGDDNSDESEILPAYQIMSGLSYKPKSFPSVQLNLGYSYSATANSSSPADHDLYNHGEYENEGHSMAAGLKLNF